MSIAVPGRVTSAVARRVAIASAVIALAACSSGGGHSAGSPSTSAANSNGANVRAFFAHDGQPLVAFERATAPLATGSVVQRQTCVTVLQGLPKIASNPNSLVPLAQRIPNPTLASVFAQDVKLRLLVVLGCSSHDGPVTSYPEIRDTGDAIKRLFRQYGIAV